MLDIKFIRENPEKVKEGCAKKNVECDVDKVLELDKRKRELLQQIEGLKARQNKLCKEDMEEGRRLKQEIKALEPQLEEIGGGLQSLLTQLPNLPQEDVPVGDETANVVLRKWGELRKFDFKPKDHLELGEALDIIDVKRAAKVSGSRFAYVKGDAALLEFALVQLAMKEALKEKFTPIVPPVFVKSEIMQAMGYVDTPDDLAERYFFEKPARHASQGDAGGEGLFLVGTAEQSVGPMHAGEVFEEKELPKRYVAFSTCFREEAGSYGKDTRGILRLHQFDKVELFSFCSPEKSREEHEFLIKLEEKLWQALEIPYQVVHLATGDMARPSASTVDIEAWMPGHPSTSSGRGAYREVSSASNTTDFQARRLNIRYKNKEGKLEFVHMLNATGFAIGRTIIAILENYQSPFGRSPEGRQKYCIKIPKVLQEYVGKNRIG